MADRQTISDPVTYPAVFSLSERAVDVSTGETTATMPFACLNSNLLIRAAVCRFGSRYLLDVDPFGTSVPLARQSRIVVYEVGANSKSISESEITVKTWTSATSFVVFGDGDIGNVRQPPSPTDTVHQIILSSSSLMDPVRSGGIDYYPSLVLSYGLTPFFDGATPGSSGDISAPGTVSLTVASAADRGIMWFLFDFATEWYLDAARTVPAVSVPGTLPTLEGRTAVRLIFADGANFYLAGKTADNGTTTFVGLPKGDSAPLDEISYLFSTTGGVEDVGEDIVSITEGGLPNQPGNDGAVYLVS